LHPKHETVFVLSIFIVVDDGGGPEVQSPWHHCVRMARINCSVEKL